MKEALWSGGSDIIDIVLRMKDSSIVGRILAPQEILGFSLVDHFERIDQD
jgi:hypothetical protein